ncbi:hypothetical protein B0H19DRAFT_1079553 [Mycena capillaripes]|nr:hypothetical protein B0H19DRAFT_1079553 [Mycena capillaripes]
MSLISRSEATACLVGFYTAWSTTGLVFIMRVLLHGLSPCAGAVPDSQRHSASSATGRKKAVPSGMQDEHVSQGLPRLHHAIAWHGRNGMHGWLAPSSNQLLSGFEVFQESTSAIAPPLASDLEQHENNFGTFLANFQSVEQFCDDSSSFIHPESSLQPDSDIKGSSSDDGHTPYELTPDEINVVIGPTTATVTSSSARDSWPWCEGAIIWTDPGVSSKVVDFPDVSH